MFGSIFDLTAGESEFAALIALVIVAGVAALARPLLFSTFDPELAVARGVPVRAVGAAFLLLVAIDAGEAAQAVGALLLLGLLAAPAGAAVRLTASPLRGIALATIFGLVSVWVGISAAYVDGSLPPSSAIIGVAALIYVIVYALTGPAARRLGQLARQ
jgi:zinc/manganese transport system permease protein